MLIVFTGLTSLPNVTVPGQYQSARRSRQPFFDDRPPPPDRRPPTADRRRDLPPIALHSDGRTREFRSANRIECGDQRLRIGGRKIAHRAVADVGGGAPRDRRPIDQQRARILRSGKHCRAAGSELPCRGE